MKVLFLLGIGLDRQATSSHLLIAVIKAVCEKGHTVHIIQKDTGGELPPIPECLSGLPVTTEQVPFRAANKDDFIARYFAELKYIHNSVKLIRSDYGAVFVQSTPAGGFAIWAIRRRLRHSIVTFNVQDVFPYNLLYVGKLKTGSAAFNALAIIQRYAYRHADHIITISEDAKDLLIEDGIPAEKTNVIYNWSYQDEPYVNVDLKPVSHMFDPKHFNVVYAGNIGVMQNVELLIEAADILKYEKSVRFHIIGDGLYKDKLRMSAEKRQLNNVCFWPFLPSTLAPAVYTAADLNVIPCVKNAYRTGFPSKTATCMACGRPIVFAVGGDCKFAQRAKAATGCFVIESDDAQALAEIIRSLQRGAHCDSFQMKKYFMETMSITTNSTAYARIITKESRKE